MLINQRTLNFVGLCIASVTCCLIAESAIAGQAAAEFNGAVTRVQDIISGPGGRLAALCGLLFAIAGSVIKFNPVQMAGAVGTGMAAGMGAGIVTASVTALI